MRRKAASISKNEALKFKQESAMCRTFASSGHRMEHLTEMPGISSPDVLIDGIKADLKHTANHNNIVKYAKKAVYKQGAEVVLFEFEQMTEKIRLELLKLKRESIRVKYFVKNKEDEIYTL